MRFLLIAITLLLNGLVFGQKAIDKTITARYVNKSLIEIFYDLEVTHGIKVYADVPKLPIFVVTRDYKNEQAWQIVQGLMEGTRMQSLSYSDNEIVVIDKSDLNRQAVESLVTKWKSGEMNFPFKSEIIEEERMYGDKNDNSSQVHYSLTIRDVKSNDPLIGALAFTDDFSINDVSDENGTINLSLTPGEYELNITYTSYIPIKLTLSIYEDASDLFEMEVATFLLDEIEIVANNAQAKVENTKTGVEMIDMAEIEAIPQALGESDLLKSLEILPGVTSAGEASSGFNVRGGKVDESLILFNDAIIFNPTHVIGFISAFNSDFIKNATLYKGYVDPSFGNRSSAVLDIASQDKSDKWIVKGGLGTSMLKAYAKGPIGENTTLAVSARGSYSDYLLNLVANNEVQNSSANFTDFNFSFDHEFSDRTSILISAYTSDDFFSFNEEFGFEWQNKYGGVILKHRWSGKFSSKISVNFGGYSTNQFSTVDSEAFSFKNGVNYTKLLLSNNYSTGENSYIKGGIEAIQYTLPEERLEPNSEMSTVTPNTLKRLGSLSLAPFISAKVPVTSKLAVEGGLRYTNFIENGNGVKYQYENDVVSTENIIGTISGNEIDPFRFSKIEPRISLNYLINDSWSVKSSYSVVSQNAQQLRVANTSVPTDLWVFSGEYIAPRIVNQISGGVFHNDGKGRFTASLEAFSKSTKNDFVLKDFPDIIANEHVETEVVDAVGSSYGVEAFISKSLGTLRGSLAYTYSRSRFNTTGDGIQVNNGLEVPSDIDIPHQLNLNFSYRISPTLILNGGYVFKTGRPITVPTGTVLIDGFPVPLYTVRNSERIPNYSRADISINLDLRKSKAKGIRSSFTFGLYNLFGNDNVYSVFFRRSTIGTIRGRQLSLIGSAIPSFSWNFVID